ncbi:magnesium transporter CorA family protein [Desulfosporosinus sp. OT]|uniref:magnesium transporter CorA family protein n=1 Tax=Desulfosporosinus sp. OT TaxID=913865 RepID=UPI0002239DC1|nr:magnesium transporter CorA family protein [Desulfosporosinus sp. OT]EGW35918.1 corA-like Mg2+ transporter family protein [Desulfosporosinus sp. OT]
MLTAYKTLESRLQEVTWDPLSKGVWVKLVNPTPEEIIQISATAQIPEHFFRFAVDEDDSPRIILGKKCILVIINVPVSHSDDRYETSPLSIILTPELTITISESRIQVLPDSNKGSRFLFDTTKRTQFFFQILYHADTVFLKFIRHIRQRTDEIEFCLRKSTNNQEVFQLLDLEKGLTYFTAALRGNVIVAETILRMRSDPQMRYLLEMHEEDEDVLESVIIENKRALELAQTYSDIMSSMMDAFSSVINNNLNQIMKFLASVTIILAIPTLISSFWSMTLKVPWQGTEIGYWLVLMFALITSGTVGIILRRKGML